METKYCHEDATINPQHIKVVPSIYHPSIYVTKGEKNHFNGILRIQFMNFIYSVKFMPLIITCDVNKRHSRHTPKNDNHLSQFHMKEFLSADNFQLSLSFSSHVWNVPGRLTKIIKVGVDVFHNKWM